MKWITPFLFLFSVVVSGQDYFTARYAPFDRKVMSPASFLGHDIGDRHTRHDEILRYLRYLAEVSDKAKFMEYGRTHEGRLLSLLCVSSKANLNDLNEIQKKHTVAAFGDKFSENAYDIPLIINMGYSVHGNEPSTSEAALLTAYVLVASESPLIKNILQHNVIFIDPVLNPDGRERHSQWANQYRSKNLVADKYDSEHNESWPRGRGNHYWFDLNRDWLLGIQPESRAKLSWYHQWYPNVLGDFHEMGTNSTFFFEPMKTNGSKNPIMPKENYGELTDLFASYFVKYLDSIGSLYFTKEVFDGTYPGYGSSYGDLQGGLALLFEQASSRGHLQETSMGDMTFAFTIRNQFVSSMAILEAALNHRKVLRKYQHEFFVSALKNAASSGVHGYIFDESYDQGKLYAFMDKLFLHKIKVYRNKAGNGFIVPAAQPQYRMVQTFFETYKEYRDSVFYDASAWSVANFYGINYKPVTKKPDLGDEIKSVNELVKRQSPAFSQYAYVIDWDDCNSPGALSYLQQKSVRCMVAFRPFTIMADGKAQSFNYGAILIPVPKQEAEATILHKWIKEAAERYNVPVYSLSGGYSLEGIDPGSRHMQALELPRVLMLIGDGVSATEAGEVWYMMDHRTVLPVTKVWLSQLSSIEWDRYNTMVMVSGSYNTMDSTKIATLKNWVGKGNTIIAIGRGTEFLVKKKVVNEKLVESPKKDSITEKFAFEKADEILGRESLGGALFRAEIDRTHPLAFGYRSNQIPVYKNNNIWLAPSENSFSTVYRYASNPHIDGYISPNNLNHYMPKSAGAVISQIGKGRAILFADNPNFRGTLYSTDRMMMNAIFFGKLMNVPARQSWDED